MYIVLATLEGPGFAKLQANPFDGTAIHRIAVGFRLTLPGPPDFFYIASGLPDQPGSHRFMPGQKVTGLEQESGVIFLSQSYV